jgi:putative hydrolase of the HAD superfamily
MTPPMSLEIIGVDADDTLWHTETLFRLTHQRFNELLAEFADADTLEAKLSAIERENMKVFGYGSKGFTLSMIQTALEVSDSKVSPAVIGELLQAGKEMMTHPIEPLPGVEDALKALAGRFRLVLITKGDLFHQESKVARSGLAHLFQRIEIVSEKTPATYARVLSEFALPAGRFAMVGNSLRSDIEPVVELGGWGVYMPYHVTWAHEREAGIDAMHERVRCVDDAHGIVPALQGIASTP